LLFFLYFWIKVVFQIFFWRLLLLVGPISWLILIWDHLFWVLLIIRHHDEVRDDYWCRLHLDLFIRVSVIVDGEFPST
jgi:hypothetical protein